MRRAGMLASSSGSNSAGLRDAGHWTLEKEQAHTPRWAAQVRRQKTAVATVSPLRAWLIATGQAVVKVRPRSLLGAGAIEFARAFGSRTGEESANAVIDWIRARAQSRRAESGRRLDPPPDFGLSDARELATGMQGELADLTRRARESLELVNAERTQTTTLVAVYRDAEDGAEWEVTVERDSATFERR